MASNIGGSPIAAPGGPPADQPAPSDVPRQAPGRPRPSPGKDSRQLFFDFNQAPRDIVRVMDESRQRQGEFDAQFKSRRLIAFLLYPIGFFFLLLDLVLGYNICTFSMVALALWVGATVALIGLRRRKKVEFGPRFNATRDVFFVLKDDVAPKRTLTGWLDLTGPEQESKEVRRKSSPSGRPVVYYQDEWLRMKTRLYDGNVLRMSLVERVKARQGYYKRGSISGKQKWKPGSSQHLQEMKLAVSADSNAYEIREILASGAIPNSCFSIEEVEVQPGRLVLKASAPGEFDAWDILNAMRFAYGYVQPRQSVAY